MEGTGSINAAPSLVTYLLSHCPRLQFRPFAVPLTAGTRLGPYEIGAQIGMGGMGEVYRATDTNLGRQIAIKVLPEAFATDAERLARFDRRSA